MARIPMRGRVTSLNASVAGSVFLFEAAAQRSAAGGAAPADQSEEPGGAVEGRSKDAAGESDGRGMAERLGPDDARAGRAHEDATSVEPALDADDLLPEGAPEVPDAQPQ
jgi:hypothetical protein